MKSGKMYLKVAAFIPAIVLVGAYIGHSAGAFQLYPQAEPTPELQPAETPQAAAPQPAPTTPVTAVEGEGWLVQLEQLTTASTVTTGTHQFMGGSKSSVIASPGSLPVIPVTGTAPEKPPVFMGGSKSKVIVVPPAAPQPKQ